MRVLKTTTVAGPITLTPASPVAGQSLQLQGAMFFTAVSGVPAPSGSLSFSDTLNGTTTVLGTAPLSSFAANEVIATFNVSALAAGTHVFTITYVGDSNYSGSTFSAPSLTVQ